MKFEILDVKNDTATVTHVKIAELTNYGNATSLLNNLVYKYKDTLESVGGRVHFENEPFETAGGIQTTTVAHLNEAQATFLVTLMRNNEIVVAFKAKLVTEFMVFKSMQQPTTDLEMLLATVQKAVEHEREIKVLKSRTDELEYRQNETTCQVQALVAGEDFFTIVGYSNIKKKPVSLQQAQELGKLATQICKAENIELGEAPHPTFGRCNSYPRAILELLFGEI